MIDNKYNIDENDFEDFQDFEEYYKIDEDDEEEIKELDFELGTVDDCPIEKEIEENEY